MASSNVRVSGSELEEAVKPEIGKGRREPSMARAKG